jgi:hypothetical protein
LNKDPHTSHILIIMKNSSHSTSKSTVKASQTGKKISKAIVKFHLKAGKPKKISLKEQADKEIEQEMKK